MATQGEYLVNNTVTECTALIEQLLAVHLNITRITERMVSVGTAALDTYTWPAGYTKVEFIALYTFLAALPPLIVDDATRDAIYELLSYIQ